MKLSPALSGCAKAKPVNIKTTLFLFFSFILQLLGVQDIEGPSNYLGEILKTRQESMHLAVGFDKWAQGVCYYLSSWAIGNMGFD